MANEAFFKEAIDSLVNHDKVKAEDVAKRAIAAGVKPQDIMQKGFVVGIRRVGDQFDEGEVYLPELMLAAAAMEAAMAICNAALPSGESETRGIVVMGTVEGDVHDIGKAIVCAYLRANGYEVHDLGRDVPVDAFVDKAIAVKADIIGASARIEEAINVLTAYRARLSRLYEVDMEEYMVKAGGTKDERGNWRMPEGWSPAAPPSVGAATGSLGV